MTRGIGLVDVKAVHRGDSLIARIAGFIIVHNIEIHRRSDDVVYLKLPTAVGWPTRKIASRFNVAMLTLPGFDIPN